MANLYRRILLFLLLLLAFSTANATHIVGGEFKLTYARGETYNLGLTLYFDGIYGSPGALDEYVRCNIFEKATGRLMDSVIMQRAQDEVYVNYNNLDCLGPTPLQTRILRYSKDVVLAEDRYTNAAGYYVVWERCCRNYAITNIVNPGGTGQAFYLEFPPVTRNGAAFRNSSPQAFTPIAALGCIGRPFVYDFSGRDPDGDAIVYRLAIPLAGNSDSAQPGQYPAPIAARPGPYRTVAWENTYSNNNQIGHADPFFIDPTTGFISFTPDRQGLFVFAIQAVEYRNGQIIGRVQREFQLLVKDCPHGVKPVLSIRADSTSPALTRRDTIEVPRLEGIVCLPLDISDTIDKQVLTMTSNLPSGTLSLFQSQGNTPGRRNPFRTRLCIDPCPGQTLPEYGLVRIITRDETCPQPLRDTAEFYLHFPPVKVTGNYTFFQINGFERSLDRTDTLVMFAGDTVTMDLSGRSSSPAIRVARQEPGGSLFVRQVSGLTLGDTVIQESYRLIAACEPDTSRIYNLILYLQAVACKQTFYLDTITVPVRILSRQIDALLTVIDSEGAQLAEGDQIDLYPGETLMLRAQGRSINTNRLPEMFYRMARTPATPVQFLTQPDDSGMPLINGQLTWPPTCVDTASGDSAYRLGIYIHLVGCPEDINAEQQLRVSVKDLSAPEIFIPNIITLNGDSLNDAFRIKEQDLRPVCSDPFDRVDVYNRWGKRVFTSQRSNFTWAPPIGASGTYHYLVKYGRKKYKGWVEVVAP